MRTILLFIFSLFLLVRLAHASTYEITTPGNNVGIGSTAPGQALDVNGAIRSTGGFNTASWVDPIDQYNASGSIATTTGSITTGTNSLVVASATGWKIGMGIAIANAGSGGNTELISYITNISGTTFTLFDNAQSTATTQSVNHDDTRAIQASLSSGKNIHLRAGNYNITNTLTGYQPFRLIGDGTIEYISTAYPYTIINQRNLSVDTFSLGTSSAATEIANLTIHQIGTPTAGYAFMLTGTQGIADLGYLRIHDVKVDGTYGGMKVNGGIYVSWFYNLRLSSSGISGSHGLWIKNQIPAGDIFFYDDQFTDILITEADTSGFDNIKVNNPPGIGLAINDSDGQVYGLRFTNISVEGGTNTGALVDMSSTSADVSNIIFTGGEFATDNGHNVFNIKNQVDKIQIIGATIGSISGVPVSNTSTGTNINYSLNNFTSLSSNVGIGTANSYQMNGLPVLTMRSDPSSLYVGQLSGSSTTQGSLNNTSIGYNSLHATSSGGDNTAVGVNALATNTTGYLNVAVGEDALEVGTTGVQNTAVGYASLVTDNEGSNNTAVGYQALQSNAKGYQNTAVGVQALQNVNTSKFNGNNTAIGYATGLGITTGQNNTIVGANVSGLASGLSNNIILADGSGNVRIQVNSSGNVGIGSTNPGQALDVVGTVRSTLGTCSYLYKCVGGVDAGVIQTSACNLCPAGSCTQMNGCF